MSLRPLVFVAVSFGILPWAQPAHAALLAEESLTAAPDAPYRLLAADGKKKAGKKSKKKEAAKAGAPEEAKTEAADATASAPAASSKGASYDNRVGKRFAVMAEMGFTEFPQFGLGLRGAMFASPSLMYEAGFTHANFEFLGIRYTSDILGARVKWFPGNSFYLTGGLAYRKMVGEVKEWLLGSDVLSHYENTSLMLDFAIGNHWQFSSFTIGCDWVGFFLPLVKMSESAEDDKTTETGSGSSTVTVTEDNESSFKKHAKDTTIQLVRFYIGWAF